MNMQYYKYTSIHIFYYSSIIEWFLCQLSILQRVEIGLGKTEKEKGGPGLIETLNGSLFVLKLIPGTNFNQTGNPLYKKHKTIWADLNITGSTTNSKWDF